MHYVFEPGFFASGPVHVALAVGTVIAITSAVVGVFTVTRGQSFAGHSLADIATTGGSGAFLIGVNQFWGYLAFGAGAAAFMEMIGIQRRRGLARLSYPFRRDLGVEFGRPYRARRLIFEP